MIHIIFKIVINDLIWYNFFGHERDMIYRPFWRNCHSRSVTGIPLRQPHGHIFVKSEEICTPLPRLAPYQLLRTRIWDNYLIDMEIINIEVLHYIGTFLSSDECGQQKLFCIITILHLFERGKCWPGQTGTLLLK